MMARGNLRGLRVLDFSRILAGPCATRILGDFGAEIIKVQTAATATGAEDQASPYFTTWNRNKLSILLNMSLPGSKQLALKLVAASDVVIENFSPRVMANWGLGYEALCRVKSDIIMASMSAMGHTGPWKNYTAFAPTIHALTGHTHLNSYKAVDPIGLGFSHSDIIAGLYCAFLVLAALDHRSKTGSGQHIDLSQYEAACTLLGPVLMTAADQRHDPKSRSFRYDPIAAAPYGFYPCSGHNRWCAIAVHNDAQWQQLRNAMGDPQWARQDRFATSARRKKYSAELDKHISAWTAALAAQEIVKRLQQVRVPAAMVSDAQDVARDPHLVNRNYFVSMPHPLSGRVTAERCPIRFMGEAAPSHRAAPLLGEHNDYIYKEVLGLTDETYIAYRKSGIIS